MSNCLNCNADNSRDYPICVNCESGFHFTNRFDCQCATCQVARKEAQLNREELIETWWNGEGRYEYGRLVQAAA
jgi:hypothetical protein